MESLMDYEGPWSNDLINLYIPVAEEMEIREANRLFNAVQAATGSLFSSEPMKAFNKMIQSAEGDVRNSKLSARSAPATQIQERKREAGQKVVEGFSRMGVVVKPKTKGARREK